MSLNTLLMISPCPISKLIKRSGFSSTSLVEPPSENEYTTHWTWASCGNYISHRDSINWHLITI